MRVSLPKVSEAKPSAFTPLKTACFPVGKPSASVRHTVFFISQHRLFHRSESAAESSRASVSSTLNSFQN